MHLRINLSIFIIFVIKANAANISGNNEEKFSLYSITNETNVSETPTNNLENTTNTKPKHRVRTSHIMFARPYETDNETDSCTNALNEFPNLFTDEQRKHGALILAFLLAIYCFTILAIICDNYFLPCMERICETLNLSRDVGAATFMAIATSAPELFVNIIGTFVTNSDIGIGTVVGSSMFNTLGVAALGGLAASTPIKLDWWPVTRDVSIYITAISLLVVLTWDGVIHWYEALILFMTYFVYFTIMFFNHRIWNCINSCIKRFRKQENKKIITNSITIAIINDNYLTTFDEPLKKYVEPKEKEAEKTLNDKEEGKQEEEEEESLWKFPEGNWYKKLFFIYTWPIKVVLFFTIPDPKKYPMLFPVTFLICILWIGTNSYLISWMISIIGHVFRIPDAVLGLTFLAAGGCLPEAISITIMSRKGEGSMGVSNSLGGNTLNILLSLGLPWFLKTVTSGSISTSFIKIESGSIEYTILALIAVALTLYIILYLNKFYLSRGIGFLLISVYVVSIVLAILSEMIFFGSENACNS